MDGMRFMTIAEQVATHLRGELSRGRWGGVLPGCRQLAQELQINSKTVEVALRQLEREGVLVAQGVGRRRRIVLPAGATTARALRVAILDLEPVAFTEGYTMELQHLLTVAGHTAFFTRQCLLDLGMKVSRLKRLVETTAADAWVVSAAPREVLEWFAAQPVPAFALFGRRDGLPLAGVGPDKSAAYAAVTHRLIGLGHRGIVCLCRRMRRLPEPGLGERAFLADLRAHGIEPGTYHLPDWEESPAGFHGCLESLFRVTPPSALIIDEAPLYVAALRFLAERGLRVPQDVSLVCTDDDRTFAWCHSTVAHIHWDSRPVVRRIVRWATNVSRGKKDLKQSLTPAKFVEGGTIGPAKSGIVLLPTVGS